MACAPCSQYYSYFSQFVVYGNIYLCFGQAVYTETAPVSNEWKQVHVVDVIAVDIDTVTAYHKRNICNVND